jgi:ligand-binding sensor domain-containing protein
MRKTTFLFFLILYCLYSAGQPQLDFDVLSIDDGFSSSRATTIIQDRAGFIWVGTWNGLNRYDGYECVVYQPGLRDSTTLSNREVTALMEDRQGYIWIGTTYGLNKLNPLTKHIKVFPLETRILSLFEDKNGSVWIGTEGEGLFHLDVKTEVLSQSMTGETVHAVIEDSREEFWLATGNGLVNFDRKTKGYKRYFHSSSSHYRNERIYQAVYSIDESEKGELWVGLEQGGVAKIIANDNKDSLRIIHYPIIDRSGHACTNYANRLLFDNDGNLWIGTWGGGVFMLEKNEQGKSPEAVRFLSYKTDVNDPFGMGGNNYISSLLVDRSGTLWAGSSVINIASIRNKGIERFNTQRIDRGKISNHWIRTIKTGKDGKVWLGSSEGLLVYDTHMDGVLSEDNLSGVLQRLGIQLQNALPVNSILPDRFGYHWIATENNGLFLLPSGAGAEKRNC